MNKNKVPNSVTPLGQLIFAINDHHEKGAFRFTPDVPELDVPPPDDCVRILNEHIAAVEPQLK